MSGKISVFLGAILLWSVAYAEEVQLRQDHPSTYTVQQGDTLWDIAGRFLTQPWQWTKIWEANPQIANPHLIFPGDVLALQYKDGRPLLTVVSRNVKLSPRVRVTRNEDAIRAIPLDAMQQFLTRPRVVTEEDLAQAPYIVGSKDEHLAFGSGSRVYVRGIEQANSTKFSIFRAGGPYRDPDTDEILGYEAEHVGDAIIEKPGDIATLYIVNASKEVLKGDRLMAETSDAIPEFVPHAPDAPVQGKIIAGFDGISQIKTHQLVALSRGQADGLEPGHVLGIFQDGEVIKDDIASDIQEAQQRDAYERAETEAKTPGARALAGIINDIRATDRAFRDYIGTPIQGSNAVHVKLPEERVGELMVIRTFDKVSYALVMHLRGYAELMDNVRNP
jgi:LysM domain